MTRIQLHFDLQVPIDEPMMEKISRANSVYGIEQIKVAPDLRSLVVEYDASRLNPMEAEDVLRKSGLPVTLRPQ